MIKNKLFFVVLGIGVSGFAISSSAYDFRNIDELSSYKKIDVDFDNNKIINTVTNKEYFSINNSYKLVDSLKGNGFNSNNDYFTIPFSDVGINSEKELTVSFLFEWGGQDNIFPMTTNTVGLWFRNNKIGFNVGDGVIYGVENPLKPGEVAHITTVIDPSNPKNCKLYINGEKQTLNDYGTNPMPNSINGLGNTIWLGGYNGMYDYVPKDSSMIDEIKVYQKNITDVEANEIANAHKIPILRGELVSNSYPKMSWATEMLQEDVLWESGYDTEFGDSRPNLKYGTFGSVGGQSFVTEDKYNGSTSLKIEDTFTNGNFYNAPATEALDNDSVNIFDGIIGLKNEVPLSITYRAKSDNDNSYARFWGIGGEETYFHYYNATIAKDVSKGDKVIEVVNMKNDKDIMSKLDANGKFIQPFYLNFDTDRFNFEYSGMYPVSADVENNLLIFNKPIPRDMKAGEKLYRRPSASPFRTGSYEKIEGNNEWNLYSANSTINISEDRFDLATRPIRFVTGVKTTDDFYIDNIKVGYSTKVRLYRDNNLVYEGYDSQLNDTNATDKANPNSISNINSTMNMVDTSNSKRKLTVTFDEVTDNGTSYDYQISAISKDGVETPKSQTNTMKVTSGIKGYSYVIDKKPNTIPDNNVNTTSTTIEKEITDTDTYYLHIKAIDNAGNSSNVIHHKIDIPDLTSKVNSSKNMIRLDWAMDDKNNKTFKVYQKKPGSSEFQSISTTNLDTTKKVRVLNIYPTRNFPNKSSGVLDLAGKVEKTSAVLTEWMQGFDKGALDIKTINNEDFEENPDKYLKDENGEYVFDVIAFGFGNIGNSSPVPTKPSHHLNGAGLQAVSDFIDAGRGVLASHQSIGLYNFNQGFNLLKDKFNFKLFKESNAPGLSEGNVDVIFDDVINWDGHRSYYWSCSNQVKAVKSGALLNYPHNIAEEGQLFTIPHSHSGWAFIMGDNWFEYANPKAHNLPDTHMGSAPDNSNFPDTKILTTLDGDSGTNNSYLSTWNNTAIIQTGHSGNVPTDDERKILANTLFYLNQLSSDNYLDDNSGQDISVPDKPQIYEHNFTEDGYIDLKFNSVKDNGSTYEYYVESQTKDKDSLTLSNVVKETITSGLKGYSFIVDESPTTVPDDIIEQVDNKPIRIKTNSSKELYVHIKAIDNVGNSSETYHYRVTDMTKPIINLTLRPNTWTNGSVTIDINAVDNESGIKHIILPNGSMIKGTSGSYTVTDNGKYYFKAVDYMGNETISSITVSNIDKKKPTVVINNNQNWTNKDVSVTITATDE